MPSPRTGPLVLIGGGPDDPVLLRTAIALAGGADARIAILPIASHEPARSGPAYVAFLADLGHPAEAIGIPDRAAAADPGVAAAVATASLLFFSGGDQSRLAVRLRHTPALDAIAHAWRAGAVLAGTSAGTMPWGRHYIAGGTSPEAMARASGVDLRPGLNLAGEILVDSHFGSRARLGRLLRALARHPGTLGIGIDDGTAAVIGSGEIRAAGSGSVSVVESAGLALAIHQPFAAGPFRIHRHAAGRAARRPAPRATSPPLGPPGPSASFIYEPDIWSPGAIERLLRSSLAASRSVGVGLEPLATASARDQGVHVRGGHALILDTSGVTEFALPATPSPVFARDIVAAIVSADVWYDLRERRPRKPGPGPHRRPPFEQRIGMRR